MDTMLQYIGFIAFVLTVMFHIRGVERICVMKDRYLIFDTFDPFEPASNRDVRYIVNGA